MIKRYFVPPLNAFQIGDLVRFINPHKNIKSEREGSLGIIYDIKTESNSTFDYDQQTVVSHEYQTYSVYWQQDLAGYPNSSDETEKYLQTVFTNEKQEELASQIGLYECETVVAGSIHYKYGDGK